jgi:hypothetical protein
MIIEEIWVSSYTAALRPAVSFQRLQKRLETAGLDKLIGTCLLKVVRSDCQPVIQGSGPASDVRSPDPKAESSTTGQRESV